MLTINKNPKTKDLEQFGVIWLPALVLLLVWLITSRLESSAWTFMLCIVAGLSMLLGAVQPMLMKPIFVGLQYLTWPIGFVVSHLLLAIIYYVLITPIGWMLRLFGYDPMRRRMPFGTMWQQRQPVIEQASYFRQF